jgi:hypothetical protein
MKFWYLFLAFIVLGPSLGAHNEMRLTPTSPMEMFEDQCNLPAPDNLVTTSIGVTNLSFAWDAVSGASGYDVVLTKVSTNTVVFSGNNLTPTNIVISSLEPGTEYRIDVWSICNGTVRGGLSYRSETTRTFVLEDLVNGYNGTQFTPGYHFPLFPVLSEGSERYFKVYHIKGESIFKVKNMGQQLMGEVRLSHDNSGSFINFVNHNNENPMNAPFSYVSSNNPGYVFLSGGSLEAPILDFSFVVENGVYYLDWTTLNNSGSQILEAIDDEKSGDMGKQKNKVQSPKEIDGVAERTESLSTETPYSIWPNPFTDLLTIQGSTPANVQLLDINGKLIYQYTMETTETNITIPTADLAKGVYLVRYETADSVKTIKVVKTN